MDRRTLSALTLAVLTGIVLLGTVVGGRALFAPLPGSEDEPIATSRDACKEGLQRGDLVHSSDVTVSVFNAGTRAGLADQTQSQLVARGFIAGDIGNAPATFNVRFVRVLASTPNDPAATLVAQQFGPDTYVQLSDADLGAGVDVVVGDGFDGLAKAPTKLRAQAPGSGC